MIARSTFLIYNMVKKITLQGTELQIRSLLNKSKCLITLKRLDKPSSASTKLKLSNLLEEQLIERSLVLKFSGKKAPTTTNITFNMNLCRR